MPIESKHPDYVMNFPAWKKCSDFYEGSREVKTGGVMYLPRPEGMTKKEYTSYKNRAAFFNGIGRTVTGLVGAMTRVPANVTFPDLISHLEMDATGDGKTFQEFIKTVLTRTMLTGRLGVLADRRAGRNMPVHLALYRETSIVNWREENGKLVLVVLEEMVEDIDPDDMYSAKIVPQYRELWLDDKGIYRARVWKQEKKGKNQTTDAKFVPGPIITPESSTGALTEIPFVFISPEGTQTMVAKAPLADLCDVNHSHYMNSADLEHGRHLVSLPTPWATGVSADENKKGLKIGSATAWLIDDDKARVGMLEFTGQGLGHLAEAIKSKQDQMSVLGAKLLAPQRKQVESAELARIHNAGDESILISIAISVGKGLEKVLEMASQWEGASSKPVVDMNKDFIDTKLASDEMKALMSLWLEGAIPLSEFLDQLKQGERLIGDPDEIELQATDDFERRVAGLGSNDSFDDTPEDDSEEGEDGS
jgi:hypothetical protein